MIRLLMMLSLFLALPAFAAPNAADNLVADISSPYVSVTTGFSGIDVIVFGALSGSMENPADLAITISGPNSQMTVRKKIRVMGFWIDRDGVIFDDVPSYFALATSPPLYGTPDSDQPIFSKLDIAQRLPPVKTADVGLTRPFYQSLIAMQREHGRYQIMPGAIKIIGNALFRATFALPSGTPLGTYSIHIYSFVHDRLTGETTLPVIVREEGLSAALFEAAQKHALLYAIATLMLSTLIGAGSAWLFQRLRG